VTGTATFGLSHKGALGGISIEILDSSGNTVGSVTSPFSTTNVKEATFNVTASDVGNTYNVRVYPTGGAFLRNDYDLWASLPSSSPSEPWCPDPYERNDESSPDIAYGLGLSSSKIQWGDPIACGSEEDWYSVQLTGGTTYYFDVFFDHSSNDDLDMEIIDSSGNAITDDNSGNAITFSNSSTTNDEQAVFTPSSNGTYRIGFQKSSTTELFAPFEIATDSNFTQSGCVDDSYQTNDNSFQRKPLNRTAPFVQPMGMCNTGGDYLSWQPSSAGTYDIEILLNDAQHQMGIEVSDSSTGTTIFSKSTSGNRAGGTVTVTAAEVTNNKTFNIDLLPGNAPSGGTAYGPYFIRIQ
jgi:hypothetical protein